MQRRVRVLLTCLFLSASAMAQTTVTTSGGTSNAVPVYTGSSSLGNSPITISGSNVGIGTTSPTVLLDVQSSASSVPLIRSYSNTFSGFRLDTSSVNSYARNWGVVSNYMVYGDFGIVQSNAMGGDFTSAGTTRFYINYAGDVGIGTTAPGAKLEVDGNIKLTHNSGGAITFADGTTQSTAYSGVSCGGDYAESVDVSGDRTKYEPGDVLVLSDDPSKDVAKSIEPYSTSVSGIYSTKPGYVGRRQLAPKSEDEVPMAMIGIVPTKVSAENGPIHVGDLLVTSSTMGHAMKGTDRSRMLGAVLGKAMGHLDSGTGVIEVLVTLQ